MADQEYIVKTYEFKLRMNRAFEVACFKTLDDARFVYNCALEQRIRVYEASGKSLSYYEQSRQLTAARAELPELRSCLRSIQQDALERLDLAFKAFFRRCQTGASPGFPRFVRHSKLSDMSGERRTRSPSGFHPAVPT